MDTLALGVVGGMVNVIELESTTMVEFIEGAGVLTLPTDVVKFADGTRLLRVPAEVVELEEGTGGLALPTGVELVRGNGDRG